MFHKDKPLVETKLMLKGKFKGFCQSSESEIIQIKIDEEKTFSFNKTTYAVATLEHGIYLIDVMEIDRSHSEHIHTKQSQKDLPIYAASLVGKVELHGYEPYIRSVTPYFEQ